MMVIEPKKTDIDKNKLLHVLGCFSEDKLSCSTGKSLIDLTAIAETITQPRIIYRMLSIESCDASVRLTSGLEFNSYKAAKVFEGCREVCCFLATIGDRVDEEIIRLADSKRSSEAYILDTIGSAAIEGVVEHFHTDAKKRMRSEGKTVTLRMSPGYCDWPLQEQRKLFGLLDAEKIGVELTKSCLMVPRKTVSGMFGIADISTTMNRDDYNPCSECGKEKCMERRVVLIGDLSASAG
jgi:hypothetical protein